MKNIIVLLAEGFEEIEAITPVDILRRLGLKVQTASIANSREVVGSHCIPVKADVCLKDLSLDDVSAVILPGGLTGSENLRDSTLVQSWLQKAYAKKHVIAAICAAPIALERAGILEGRHFTCYPGFEAQAQSGIYDSKAKVVIDGPFVTACGPGASFEFAYAIATKFVQEDTLLSLQKGMQFLR